MVCVCLRYWLLVLWYWCVLHTSGQASTKLSTHNLAAVPLAEAAGRNVWARIFIPRYQPLISLNLTQTPVLLDKNTNLSIQIPSSPSEHQWWENLWPYNVEGKRKQTAVCVWVTSVGSSVHCSHLRTWIPELFGFPVKREMKDAVTCCTLCKWSRVSWI